MKRFNLTRWFSITSLVCVALISMTAAHLITVLFTTKLIGRDAQVTMEFVQSVIAGDRVADAFARDAAPQRRRALEETLDQISRMPDVLRTNVYGADRTVLWSTDAELVGRRFPDNAELNEALEGALAYESGVVRKEEHLVVAHPFSEKGVPYFIEIYVPIRQAERGAVVGVVELYKTPDALSGAIHDARRVVWASAAAGALLLFAALFWMARHADSIMREQQERLVESESLALVGEMAAAVAHTLRNPLAAIRSSAELAIETGPSRDQAEDIVGAVDRVEAWVRELLGFTRPISGQRVTSNTNDVIRRSLQQFQREFAKRPVDVSAKLEEPLPLVRADSALLGQVLVSLLANAADAVRGPGRIEVASRARGQHVEIDVADNGVGIPPAELDKVFKPFFTTKARGLGLGLPLAKRILERYGGTLSVASTPGAGTTFTIRLAVEG